MRVCATAAAPVADTGRRSGRRARRHVIMVCAWARGRTRPCSESRCDVSSDVTSERCVKDQMICSALPGERRIRIRKEY